MAGEREEAPASTDAGGASPGEQPARSASPADRSLVEDIEDLLADSQTWLAAELAYQKARAAFIGSTLKSGVALAAVAALLALVALIGLAVGLIIALAPLVTAWGATAIVVGVLLLVAFLLVRAAAARIAEMGAAIREDRIEGDGQ